MRGIVITIYFIFFSVVLFSQNIPQGMQNFDRSQLPKIGTIKGKLIEQGSKVPLEYANVAVYYQHDSVLAGGGIADTKGFFNIPNLTPGTYYFEAKFIGFDKLVKTDIRIGREKAEIDLGVIELIPASENIGEVTVFSQDRPIVYEIDKKIIDPSQFPSAANGTATDVLANTPSVSVDIEGNVSLRGSSNFTVLIDGRPTPFSAADALEQIPASTIHNIEIITNPSAKFDPDGNAGIININTKKSKLIGISGIVNASIDTYGSLTGDFLFNYKTGKFNFFVGANRSARVGSGQYERLNITYGPDTITTTSKGENNRNFNNGSIKAGVDYFINDYNTLSFSANVNSRNREHGGTSLFTESSSNGYLLSTLTENNSTGGGNNVSFSLDYKRKFLREGQELTAYLFYRNGKSDEYSFYDRYINDSIFYNGQKNWEFGEGDDIRFKLDYVHPITDKMKIEAGLQSRMEEDFEWNDVHWYTTPDNYQPTNESDYYNESVFTENIHSAYITWSNSGQKLGCKVGLRGEYTDRSIAYSGYDEDSVINRLDLFPTFHASYNLTDKQQLIASYTRRIQRPRSYYLEPFITYTDAYNVRRGNTGILPELIDSYELGYQLQLPKGFVTAEIYHRQTNNRIESVQSVYAENVMMQTFRNIGTDYATGLEFMLNYRPANWYMFNLMGNVYRYQIVGQLYGKDINTTSTNWHTRLSNTFTITKTTKLQIDGMYNSPTVSAQGRREGFLFTNMAVRQDLFKNKLNITLSVRDLFSTAKFEFESQGPDFYSKTKFNQRPRIVSLSLSYKINNYRQQRDRNNGDNSNGNNETIDFEGMGGMQ
jgi:outer membrane receptor protein involved in Fe transport